MKKKKHILHGIKVEEYQETKVDKIITFFFYTGLSLMLLIALLVGLFLRGQCASVDSSLPYIPNSNDFMLSDDQVALIQDSISQYDSTVDFSEPYIIFFSGEGGWYDYSHWVVMPTYFVYFPQYSSVSNGYSLPATFPNGTNLSSYQLYSDSGLDVFLGSVTTYTVQARAIGTLYNGFEVNKMTSSNTRKGFFGSASITHITNAYFDFSFRQDYPVYTNAYWLTSDSLANTGYFLVYPKAVIGGVTSPDLTDTSDLPNTEPDINDYLPNTPEPTIDNTSVESLLESLIDWLKWKKQQYDGRINFIVDKVSWLFQKLIASVNSSMKNFVDNLTSFFRPIFDHIFDLFESLKSILTDIKGFISYITEPLNVVEIDTALENSDIYGLVTVADSFYDTFNDYFDNIPQLSTLSFSIPYTILNSSGYITIDFSWYSSIKNDVLPWIIGFLYAGFGLFVFRSIPNIIHGVSGVLQKGG